jgi:hypothetical protein
MNPGGDAQGRYLFAVATGLSADDLDGQEGLRGRPLELVEHSSLQAVVCDVDLHEFGEEPLRRNLEDLAWVEQVARTHDSVVRAVAARATVAPMRLVTVCIGDDSVVERLRQWEEPLRAALDRVSGAREWSVKAYGASGAPEPAQETGRAASQDRSTGSGVAYLQRKRDAVRRRDQGRAALLETAEAVHVALAGRTKASRLLEPQDPQLTGRAEPMVLNGAYLVHEADEQRFRELVEELQRRHSDVILEIAGPWAPYSFAVLETP